MERLYTLFAAYTALVLVLCASAILLDEVRGLTFGVEVNELILAPVVEEFTRYLRGKLG